MADNPWTTLTSRVVYENAWLRLREDTVVRPDGGEGIYGVVELGPSVGVLPVDDRGRVALVTQWRYVHDRLSVEIPVGGCHPADDGPLGSARRELREETGLVAADWRPLGTIDLSNGVTSDTAHLFLATGLTQGPGTPDPEEDLTVSWHPFDEVLAMVLDGRITEASSVAATLKVELLRREGAVRVGGDG